jgi:hypothetical protein
MQCNLRLNELRKTRLGVGGHPKPMEVANPKEMAVQSEIES